MTNINNIQSPLDALLANMTANSKNTAVEQYNMYDDSIDAVETEKASNYDGLTEADIWKRLGQKGLLYK